MIFLLEMLDSTVKGIKQLEKWAGGIPCITAIPLALTDIDRRRRKVKTVLYIVLNLSLVIAGVVVVGYSHVNHIIVDIPIPLPF